MRVVRTPAGAVVLDETGRLAGRGAYFCADGSCWRQAVDKGALQRALGVPLPEELKYVLRAGSIGDVSGARAVAVRTRAADATIDVMNEGEAVGQE